MNGMKRVTASMLSRAMRSGLARILGICVLLLASAPAWSALATDVTVFTNRSNSASSVTSPVFSTAAGGELLLAFVATDGVSPGMSVTSVTGAGLTWTLVRRTNAQLGTAEVWRALAPTAVSGVTVRANLSQSVAASLTIVSFTGADPSGTGGSGAIGATGGGAAATGAPTASLITTRANSLVFGVGADWDRAIARTLPPGQSLVNQYLATVGDTYWVQRQNAATAASGTTVTINATAPTTDRYNLAIVEVLPAPPTGPLFPVSGTIAPASLGSAATVTLKQGAITVDTATVDVTGSYSFPGVEAGTYSVTPVKAGVDFVPTTQSVSVNGGPATVPAFSAAATISGTVTPAASGAGTLMTLAGPSQTSVTTVSSSGAFGFSGLAPGSYTLTPNKNGFSFNPPSQTITISNGGATATFTATLVQSFTISGTITPVAIGNGASVQLGTSPPRTTTADSLGNFRFTGLASGVYPVTPTKSGFTFTPASRSVTVAGADVTGVNFAGQAQGPAINYPDLSVIMPVDRISIVGSGPSRVLQYTHDTFNGGSGPLVIQPEYNPATGLYQGTQYLYSFSGGTWTLVRQVPIAGTFFFHAEHGHFHFPLASYGLYAVAADGGVGSPLVLSEKNGFCINDSFLFDPSLPNAGALGNLGSCSDPTALRGLNIGAVDEYDQTDFGQSVSLANVPDGTYWLRALVDANNFLAESDKSNNETDVLLTISGNTVTVLKTVVPILPAPPDIALTSPADQTGVSGMVTLTANPSIGAAVQFLLDGQPLGTPVTTAPYTLAWDSRTVPDGSHWIAAQTTDPTSGITGTSAVARVTVGNAGSNPPLVTLTSPAAGSTVSAVMTLSATVASSAPITSVQFFVDGAPLGAPLTAPPFLTPWDTRSVADGQHTITASATDAFNLTGTSSAVLVTVDNSHPPLPISIDKTVFRDASDTMTTPAFSTTTASALVVAFVGYDGPPTGPQTASVSGAGLIWTLVQRSNLQSGTSEIWVAKASGLLTNVTVTSQPSVLGFHGSLVVVAFTNAAGAGIVGRTSAPSGAPDIFLPGVSAGNWVFAVGNDWDRAIARTPVSGQVLVHQRVDTTVGDTFWVQSTAAPAAASGIVTIHDSAPTADQWNYAAVEIVAAR